MIQDYYDGRIPNELRAHMDIEMEIRRISEAYCLQNNIPVRRKFTDAELEESFKRLAEALMLQKPLEVKP